jgi:renalase
MNSFADVDTETSELDPILDFAIIGAGIAGLTAACKINDLGFIVGVFEKARGTGGRMSSKRVQSERQAPNQYSSEGKEYMAFDLGCASITAQSEEFSKQLDSWHVSGVIAPWWKDDQGQNHYVAVPRNSSLTRHLSKNLECHFGTKVIAIEQVGTIWHLFIAEEPGPLGETRKLLARAKNVIIATPPAQTQELLPSNSPFKDQLDNVEVSPQWVMAVEVDNSLLGFPAIQYPHNDIIFSISQEHQKPGRSHGSVILQVQATPSWTSDHLELSPEQVSNMLVHELERHLEEPLNIINSYAHRWLYSCVAQGIQAKDGYLWDVRGLGLIGDYIQKESDGENRNQSEGVESAWLSGKHLAERLTLNGQC